MTDQTDDLPLIEFWRIVYLRCVIFLNMLSIIVWVDIKLLVLCRGLRRCRAEKHCCMLVWLYVGVWQTTSIITSWRKIGESVVFLYLWLAARYLQHNLILVLP